MSRVRVDTVIDESDYEVINAPRRRVTFNVNDEEPGLAGTSEHGHSDADDPVQDDLRYGGGNTNDALQAGFAVLDC